MSSLPISYQVYSTGGNHDEFSHHHHHHHIYNENQQEELIHNPSSSSPNNNELYSHQNHHHPHHRSMNMFNHHLTDFINDTESVSSSCSPSSLLPSVLDMTTTTTTDHCCYPHQKGTHSFDSTITTTSASTLDDSRDDHHRSRNNSLSSSLNDDEPIFILSPTSQIPSMPSSLIADCSFNKDNDPTNSNHHENTIILRSSPRDIKPISTTTKTAYSLNETKSTQVKGGQIEEGISELEQLFASRRAFNSLSNKYSTDNLLKEQKKRGKHSLGRENLLLQQPLTSASSFTATSSSFLEPSSRAIRSTKSSSSLSPNSSIDSFEEIKSIIQAYYNYESFVESADGREELRLYLRKRHNEEMLLMLETRITFLSFYEEGSNFYVGKRALLKVKEFQMIYSQFIDTNSQFCINIDSTIRNRFVKLNPRVNSVTIEEDASRLVKEIDECLDTLHFSVSLQVKTEIFSQFKKTEEFQTFILSKIIELQGKKAWEELERQTGTSLYDSPPTHGGFFSFLKKNPQNVAIKKFEEKSIEEFLFENNLSEYFSQFKKKKLYVLSQIQNYSCDDYLKLGVIKVSHQTRLIRLVGQYFKSYCNKS